MTNSTLCLLLLGLTLLISSPAGAASPPPTTETAPTMETVQHRAFDFFWKESDPITGLTKDRAQNLGDAPDTHTIASTAATGYALAALPIGVSHKWITRDQGYARALTTLRFVHDKLPNNHGFYYHFVDKSTGERQWKCEISSIDTALLLLGARVAGDYWPGTEVQKVAESLTDHADWPWMQRGEGTAPQELAFSMGWQPETGWINSRWRGYSEASCLYWLAMGSRSHPVSPDTWDAWDVVLTKLEGYPVFGGPEPLFMAQMAPAFINVDSLRDRQGRDWWNAWRNAHLADHAFCRRNPDSSKTFAEGFWGISANDQPDGYGADYPAAGRSRGTVSPTAMLTSVIFTPNLAHSALQNIWRKHGSRIWGRYGFSNAFNVEKNWYDKDVIGIDLGMMLLADENAHSGLIWRLMNTDAVIRRGLSAAGFTTKN